MKGNHGLAWFHEWTGKKIPWIFTIFWALTLYLKGEEWEKEADTHWVGPVYQTQLQSLLLPLLRAFTLFSLLLPPSGYSSPLPHTLTHSLVSEQKSGAEGGEQSGLAGPRVGCTVSLLPVPERRKRSLDLTLGHGALSQSISGSRGNYIWVGWELNWRWIIWKYKLFLWDVWFWKGSSNKKVKELLRKVILQRCKTNISMGQCGERGQEHRRVYFMGWWEGCIAIRRRATFKYFAMQNCYLLYFLQNPCWKKRKIFSS